MRHRTSGFSLVEVLVAMAVFSISAAAVSSLMMHSTAFMSQSNYRSQAITCAQAALEDIRTQAYEDIVATSDATPCTKGSMEFSVQWDVTENTPANGMKTIVVTVTWLERGTAKDYVLQTIYSKITA
jgi:prepilin-type N-terminal cleavage/methylation domain-containing protein